MFASTTELAVVNFPSLIFNPSIVIPLAEVFSEIVSTETPVLTVTTPLPLGVKLIPIFVSPPVAAKIGLLLVALFVISN